MSSKPQQLQRHRSSPRALRLLLAFLAFQIRLAVGQVVPAHPLETAEQRNAAIASTVTGIISYARWPADPQPIRICVVAKPLYAQGLLTGQADAGRKIVTQEMGIDDPSMPSSCNVLYLGALDEKQRLALIASLAGHAILTISENGPACNAGSMFCLHFERNRVGLQMNLDSIARSGVHVDPHVLLLSAPKSKVTD
ncbi:MAG: YfiR family protein [Deltaproteobacteria bacterium]